jgi:hypothetical protein
MLDTLGIGETQMPEAVGLAFALDGRYVVKAMLIDRRIKPADSVCAQLIAGPPYNGSVVCASGQEML